MATIAQIVDFMNENKMVWHPQLVVEIEHEDNRVVPGYESYPVALDMSDPNKLYIRYDSQRYIGHYYVWHNMGNNFSGCILLPLNTGKYLKANFNVAV